MPGIFNRMTDKKARDVLVLADFVQIFCREKHGGEPTEPFSLNDEKLSSLLEGKHLELCRECSRLFSHGTAKLMLCPHDPKPMCKKCETQCYAPGYRESIREVMRFSGIYLIKHGRLDLIAHYYL